jgi:hypothetical protein
MIEDNFISMAEIARASGIKVILASITPANDYPWEPEVDPVPTIREDNSWLKDYCAKQGLTYLDYYSAMSDEKGVMKPGLAKDGVHPTAQGYAIMGPLAEAAIAKALIPDWGVQAESITEEKTAGRSRSAWIRKSLVAQKGFRNRKRDSEPSW